MKYCTIFIDTCLKCPYCYQSPHDDTSFTYGDFTCTKTNREVNPYIDNNIPNWCILEDITNIRGENVATSSFNEEFILNKKTLENIAKKMNLTTDEVLQLLGIEFEEEDKKDV